MINPKHICLAMQGLSAILLIVTLATYDRVSWDVTKLLVVACGTMALVTLAYTLAHYIAEELWLRKMKHGGPMEMDDEAL